jgi:hypothetical protein
MPLSWTDCGLLLEHRQAGRYGRCRRSRSGSVPAVAGPAAGEGAASTTVAFVVGLAAEDPAEAGVARDEVSGGAARGAADVRPFRGGRQWTRPPSTHKLEIARATAASSRIVIRFTSFGLAAQGETAKTSGPVRRAAVTVRLVYGAGSSRGPSQGRQDSHGAEHRAGLRRTRTSYQDHS